MNGASVNEPCNVLDTNRLGGRDEERVYRFFVDKAIHVCTHGTNVSDVHSFLYLVHS